ncbi:MAG: hypothetical protein L0H55_08985 [Candidatus Nitrosocosmicus sp.]|nr:hypothetical protein [Candidatus Nitrosocosmicus sp.]
MSDPDNSEPNRNTITLSVIEIEKISKLYQTALDLTSADGQAQLTDANPETSTSDLINKKRQAWHDVQSYLEELGKKYNYDPEKYVINKITRKLELYKPNS